MEFKNQHGEGFPFANRVYSASDLIRFSCSCLMFLVLSACGASSQEDSGLCKLSCGKAKIGDSIGMKVNPLFNASTAYSCSTAAASTPFPRPLVLRFSVTNAVDGALYGKPAGSTVDVPAQGLAFNIITSGSVFYAAGSSKANGELSTNGFEPPEYTGVATPMDEWCTDSCGVLTVQVWPQCPGVGETVEGSVVVSSGSLSGTVPVSVNTQDPTALAPSTKDATAQRFEDVLHSFNRKLYHSNDMGKLRLY